MDFRNEMPSLGITAIGKDVSQPGEPLADGRQYIDGPVAVLKARAIFHVVTGLCRLMAPKALRYTIR